MARGATGKVLVKKCIFKKKKKRKKAYLNKPCFIFPNLSANFLSRSNIKLVKAKEK